MTSRLSYEMSSALIARAAAHRLRELGAVQIRVTLPQRSKPQDQTLAANVCDRDTAEAHRLIRGLDPDAVYVGSRSLRGLRVRGRRMVEMRPATRGRMVSPSGSGGPAPPGDTG